MPTQVVVMAMVDALKYGKVTQQHSPFIHKLKASGTSGPMIETFAFQTRPAYLAGLTPEECEVANLYYYAPEESPYYFTRYAPLPDGLYRFLLKVPKVGRGIRRIIRYFARRIESVRGHTASRYYAYPEEIPYSLLRYFAYSEKKLITDPAVFNTPTVFDLLREQNSSWLWLAYPTHEQRAHQILESFAREFTPDVRFIYLHFSETDWAGHEHGPDSPHYSAALSRIDEALKEIHQRLAPHYDDVKWLVYGDHGMVEVDRFVDVQALLDTLPLRRNLDYHYFLDSTQARFWVSDERVKESLTCALNGLDGGTVLTQEHLSDLHFRFAHNRFGDIVFVTHDRTIVYPNFFQSSNPVKGMHGYLPDVTDNMAEFVVSGSGVPHAEMTEPINMVDVFPTVCDLLNLQVPKGNYESVLRKVT